MKNLKTYTQFLNEKAIPLDDILKEETQQGLLLRDKTSRGDVERQLVLYDFDDKQILAYMTIKKWKGTKQWEVLRSVAVKNYGPDIYDFALMAVHPEPLRPASTIKPEAIKVWQYYTEKRADVTKTPVEKEERVKKYDLDMEHKHLHDAPTLEVLNTYYTMKPVAGFTTLIEKGKEYATKYKTKVNDIFLKADKYFWKRYDDRDL